MTHAYAQAAVLVAEQRSAGEVKVGQLGRRGRLAPGLRRVDARSARPARARSEAKDGLQLCSLDQLGS